MCSTFKTDITKVGFVFSISNFFVNKISQGRKSVSGLAAAIYIPLIIVEKLDISAVPSNKLPHTATALLNHFKIE